MDPHSSTPTTPPSSNETSSRPGAPDSSNSGLGQSASSPLANSSLPPRRSRKKTILIVVSVIAVVVIALFTYFFIIGQRVINTSNTFMKNVTTDKVDEAVAISDISRDGLTKAAAAMKGSTFSRSNQKAVKQGDKQIVYLLYTLGSSKYKEARTGLEQIDGKWKVTSFVFSPNSLKLVPDASSDTTTTSSAPSSTTGACLVASDFDGLYRASTSKERPANLDFTGVSQYTSNVHFNPNSLDFTTPAQINTDVITNFANFAKQNSAKQFTIHLKGSVGTTSQADLTYANQRAQKVKTLLMAQGAAERHITVDAPGSVAEFGSQGEAERQSARSVVMKIDGTCASDTNGR